MNAALQLIMDGGRVKRYHAKTTLHEETVAAHSYVVAWLVTLASDYKPSANLLLAALQHDIPEAELGDMPGPTKRKLGLGAKFVEEEAKIFKAVGMPDFYGTLTEDEAVLLKLADSLSGWLTCVYEESLGNKTLRRTRENYRSYVLEFISGRPALTDFASAIMIAAELHEGKQQ
jgi:5'-deoxynucleotidase YfbR-like HD superfamily hydrolase